MSMFFLAGWLAAAWPTRIPAIKDELGLSESTLALAIVGLEAGAVTGLPAAGALVARVGSRTALRIGFGVFAPAVIAVSLAGSLAALTAALAAAAIGNSIVDVAMNAHGVELERRTERALLSRLHAGHPLGLVAGGVAGTAATAAGLSVTTHFALVGAGGLVAALAASAWLTADGHAGGSREAFARPSRRLLVLGLLAFCAFGLDGAAFGWSAVDLREEHGASSAVAAVAFTGFALALAAGRLLGDTLRGRAGAVRLVQGCAGVAAAAAALVVVAPSAGFALAGWVLFGAGLAAVAPTVLGAAPRIAGAPPGMAIAAVSTVGYLGSFSGAPAIGGIAGVMSLSVALLALVLVSAAMGLLAGRALRLPSPACSGSS